VKSRILSDPGLRQDFDACVNLYQDYIEQNRSSTTRDSQISAFQAKTRVWQRKCLGRFLKPDMSVEDRYYKKWGVPQAFRCKEVGPQDQTGIQGTQAG
jgi:hypothetical protein